MIDDNEFAAAPLIIERLKSQNIPGLVDVLPALSVASLFFYSPLMNAGYVAFGGEIDVEASPIGEEAQHLTQRWIIAIVIQDASSVTAGRGPQVAVGPIYTRVRQVLSGWSPFNSEFQPLRRLTAPEPRPGNNGQVIYEIPFALDLFPSSLNDLPI